MKLWLINPGVAERTVIAVTDEQTPPADLVELKAAFWAADAECAALAESDADLAELRAARKKRLEIVVAMYAHDWWATAGPRYPADQRLNAAAKALNQA